MPADDMSPEEALDDFSRAFARLDLDAVMAHIAPDAHRLLAD